MIDLGVRQDDLFALFFLLTGELGTPFAGLIEQRVVAQSFG